jgi:proline dehydrogenase
VSANIDFNNTEIAFRSLTDDELKLSHFLFKALGYQTVVQMGPEMVNFALSWRLPIKRPVKKTIFKQFCGGETLEECRKTIDLLSKDNIGTMLDYAVEGRETEDDFENTCLEVLSTIEKAAELSAIRTCVIKLTGLARFALLEKVSSGTTLDGSEMPEWKNVTARVDRLCKAAAESNTCVFVDAEESWIQEAIDELTTEMMAEYNRERTVVYNTVQMYRWGRLDLLQRTEEDARKRKYRAGIKLVRGAYLEKEREWAEKQGVKPAVHARKKDTDADYNEALRYIVEHLDRFNLCAATHNEASTKLLVRLMEEKGIETKDPRIEFSQLYGMGNHLTYNLAHHGYNTSKYVPYGPVELVLPYLTRRAQENSSVAGTTSRELGLVTKEMERRGLARPRS